MFKIVNFLGYEHNSPYLKFRYNKNENVSCYNLLSLYYSHFIEKVKITPKISTNI